MPAFLPKLRARLVATTCLVLAGTPLAAEDFVITGLEITTNGGFTIDGNDTFTIEQGGSIFVGGVPAVAAFGDFYTLTNRGTILTDASGAGLSGVTGGFDNGNIVTLLNDHTGVITTGVGISLAGQFAGGNSVTTLENRGTVNASIAMSHAGGSMITRMLNSGRINVIPDSFGTGVGMSMAVGPLLFNGVGNPTQLSNGSVQMINSGSIDIFGPGTFAMALAATAAQVQLINSGIIRATDGATGIDANLKPQNNHLFFPATQNNDFSSHLLVENSGTIVTTSGTALSVIGEFSTFPGPPSEQVETWFATVNNSGSIETGSGTGVWLREEDPCCIGPIDIPGVRTFHNSGSIKTGGGVGVQIDQDGYVFINSGKVYTNSAALDAIDVTADVLTMRLLDGSEIFGLVDLATPSGTILEFGDGLDAAVTFSGGEIPTTINSANGHAILGDTVYTADTRDMVALDNLAADISQNIVSTVDAYGFGTSGSSEPGRENWVQVIGGLTFDLDGPENGYHGFYGGMLAGGDMSDRFGVFGGVTGSTLQGTDATPTDTDAITLLGGIYGDAGFANYTLVAGYGFNTVERSVSDNMVAGGVDKASGDSNTFFITPALTFNELFGANSQIQLTYTGTYNQSSSYAFTNSTLAIDSRWGHQGTARIALGTQLQAALLRYGVDLTVRDDASINYSVNGVAVNGANLDDTFSGRAFLRLEREAQQVEMSFDSKGQLAGNASFLLTF